MSHVAKRTEFASEYLYRGYLLSKHVNENGNHDGQWNVAELIEHAAWGKHEAYSEWVVCDTWSTLRDCKGMIDHWISNEEESCSDDNE